MADLFLNSISSGESFGNNQFNLNFYSNPILSPDQFGQFGILNVAKISNEFLISTIINEQLPDFVRDNYPLFVSFLEAYYEWLESEDQTYYHSKRIKSYQDIDETIDEFVNAFQKEMLVNIPSNIITDKRKLLKHIRDYYRARGTEKSYRLFFRMLFNESSEFYYPRKDILKASDGKWIQFHTLRVLANEGNIFDLKSNKIVGNTNNSTAFVEKIQQFQFGSLTIYEIFLNPSSITGIFTPYETIKNLDGTIEAIISPVLLDIEITDPGKGYSVDEEIEIIGSGIGAKAYISEVSDIGEVEAIRISNFGVEYDGTIIINFPVKPNQALGEATIGALCVYPGYFMNDDGKLNYLKYIHDNYYYQQFSYVTILGQSLNYYKEELKKQLHPAGYKLFGRVRVENLLDATIKLNENQQETVVEIDHKDLNRYSILKDGLVPLNWKEEGLTFGGINNLTTHIYLKSSNKDEQFVLGPNHRSLQKEKFWHKPYEGFDPESILIAPGDTYDPITDTWSGSPIQSEWHVGIPVNENDGYWDQFGNTQIKDLGHFIIDEFETKPWKKINIMPDPGFEIEHTP